MCWYVGPFYLKLITEEYSKHNKINKNGYTQLVFTRKPIFDFGVQLFIFILVLISESHQIDQIENHSMIWTPFFQLKKGVGFGENHVVSGWVATENGVLNQFRLNYLGTISIII